MKTTQFLSILFLLFHLNINSQNTESSSDNTIASETITPVKKSTQSIIGTENWLKDLTTVSFGNPANRKRFKNSVNGVRLLFEPQFGHVFQTVDNRIEANDFNKLLKFGVETNLFKGFISLQFIVIFPNNVQFDNLSMVRTNQHILDPAGRAAVDYGAGVGLSFFDGIIAVGYAGLFFDKRNFINMSDIPKSTFNYQANFVYFAIQPVSAIKSVVQNMKR